MSNGLRKGAVLLVAGPNLTLDRTSSIAELRRGEVLRVDDVAVTPGGKGVNVCRAARALGLDAALVAFVPGHTGRAVAGLLDDEGIDLLAVPCEGELRSTAIVIEASGRTTVLNEPGPPLAEGDWAAYTHRVGQLLPSASALVCSGSVPPGAPDSAYAELASLAKRSGRVCVVDTSGAVLRSALVAGPDVVVPNLGEAEVLLGCARGGESVDAVPDARERAVGAARELVAAGARAAVVTAAAAGAAFAAAGGRAAWIAAPAVSVRNPIGAGDAFTAALASTLAAGADLVAAVTHAVGAGSASVESALAGALDAARARELAGRVSGVDAP